MRRLLILPAICLLFLYSCKNKQSSDKFTDTPTTGETTIAVDASFQPLLEAELPVFHAVYKYAKVNASYMPESDAINLLLRDSVRLAIVSRPLNQKEMDYFHNRKFFPREVKLAVDGIAVIVNSQNPDSLFTLKSLKSIMLGETKNWKELNPSSKLDKIKVIFDNPKSSTVRFIVDSLTRTGTLGEQLSAMEYTGDVVNFVKNNPGSIGLIGVSWISDRDDPKCLTFLKDIRVAGITTEETATYANTYQPFQAYIATGKYPLTRFVYAILSEPRAGLGSGLVSFIASDKGQRIIQKTGVLPWTQPVRLVNIVDE